MADKKLTLVPNWRDAHTWASMWWSGLGFVTSLCDLLAEIWEGLGHRTTEHLPYAGVIGLVLFGATMIGRLLVWTHEQLEDTDGNH